MSRYPDLSLGFIHAGLMEGTRTMQVNHSLWLQWSWHTVIPVGFTRVGGQIWRFSVTVIVNPDGPAAGLALLGRGWRDESS